jgi:4-hydroxy-2-oxoheptanedioate aldolase
MAQRGAPRRGVPHETTVYLQGDPRGRSSDEEAISMRENTIRSLWGEGKAAVNGWCAIPSSFSAETMAHQGWDSVTVDLQHGVVDYQMAVTMLQAISTTATMPIVRVPWLEPGIVGKVLDAGAYGVICPMINTRADAERLVGACRYPPKGYRSFGPIRALLYAGADYPKHANDTVIVFAMIETREALNNLDEILSVPGLDAIYVGPADLSNSLGCTPRFDQDEKPVLDAIDVIVTKAKKHGVVAGIHNGTPEYAQKMVDKGFRFVTIASDARLMAAKAQEVIGKMRALSSPPKAASTGTY